MPQSRRDRVITGAVLGALPLLLATGCSFDFSIGGPSAVPAADVAEQSSTMLSEQIGQAPDDFTCSDDLPAEVDAEIRCELVDGDQTYGVTITTTSVDGDNVEWNILVDETPVGGDTAAEEPTEETTTEATTTEATGDTVPAADVAEQSAAELESLVGQAPEDFTCSENLPAQVGAEIRCTLVDGGMNYGVTITTTSVNGGDVQWDILVDDAPL